MVIPWIRWLSRIAVVLVGIAILALPWIRGAVLSGAHLEGANLSRAATCGAMKRPVTFLEAFQPRRS
jgi:hypothetical protein